MATPVAAPGPAPAPDVRDELMTLIDQLDNYFIPSRKEPRLKGEFVEEVKKDPARILELVNVVKEILRKAYEVADERRKRKLGAALKLIEEYAPRLPEAIKKAAEQGPSALSNEDKMALFVYDILVFRVAESLLRGKHYERKKIERLMNDPAGTLVRIISTSFSAEVEREKNAKKVSNVFDWLGSIKGFDYDDVDVRADAEHVQEFRRALEIRKRGRSKAPAELKAESKEEIKKHVEDVLKLIEKVREAKEKGDVNTLLYAGKQLAQLYAALTAIRNPDNIWDVLKDPGTGEPLYERFVRAAERSGRKGLASPKFIAYNYAWRILSGFYLSSNIARALGIDVARLPRSAYNALRRKLSEYLDKEMQARGLANLTGRTFNELTDDEKRRLSEAVVAAVMDTLREVGAADVVEQIRPEDIANLLPAGMAPAAA